MGLLALLAACALVIVVGAVAVPLVRSINGAYVARRVEDAFPEFQNSLVTYVQMSRTGADDGMLALVANQAARRVHLVNIDAALDSRRFTRFGYSLVALMLAVFAYSVFAPKSMWTSFMRVTRPWENIAAPTRTEIREVLPGDARLSQGADLVVTASIGGAIPEAAAVRWSRDGALWQAAPMEPTGENRWRGVVPHVESDVTYRVAAGDAVSQVYRVSALAPPVVTSVKARLLYPSYTRLAPLEVEDGNIEAPEGTQVQLIVETNKDLQSASLKLPREKSAALKTKDELALGGFTVTDTGRYAIVITDTDGLSPSRPVEYDILALPDREPKVSLEGPADGAVARPGRQRALPVQRRRRLRSLQAGLPLRDRRRDRGHKDVRRAGRPARGLAPDHPRAAVPRREARRHDQVLRRGVRQPRRRPQRIAHRGPGACASPAGRPRPRQPRRRRLPCRRRTPCCPAGASPPPERPWQRRTTRPPSTSSRAGRTPRPKKPPRSGC